jgi:hypothetical protein
MDNVGYENNNNNNNRVGKRGTNSTREKESTTDERVHNEFCCERLSHFTKMTRPTFATILVSRNTGPASLFSHA